MSSPIILNTSERRIREHPFKEGVRSIIEDNFAPDISKNFLLVFEAETFKKDEKSIFNQLRDDNLILQIFYKVSPVNHVFVCDVYSFETKPQTVYRILRYITDCIKADKFGSNWIEGKDKKISEEIRSGKYETPSDEGSIGSPNTL